MSRKQTEDTKRKISQSLRGNIPWNKKLKPENKSGLCKKHLYQNKEYREKISKKNRGKCGGYRIGSTKNYHSGWYDEQWFDSSWELAYYLWCKENGISIKRNTKQFNYILNEEKRKYIPDFIIEGGTYIEIKGSFPDNTVEAKEKYFPHSLKVIREQGMKHILEYIKSRYGDEFWTRFYGRFE